MTERILEVMQEAMVVLDPCDFIENTNAATLKLFGLSRRSQLIGKHVASLFLTPDQSKNIVALTQGDGHFENCEATFISCNGKKFAGQYSAFLIKNDKNEIEAKVIFIQDVSERKKAELTLARYAEQLEKKNIELDQFAYIVSHDLKAPLRAINNLSVWLMEDLLPALSPDSLKNLEMMRGRVARMEALINGILEYSKVGRTSVASESVEVGTLLYEIVELLSAPPHIRIFIDKDMPTVEAQKIMLLQVFSNLISNAIKYNDKKEGIVNISCQECDDHYEFTVRDNGPGIAKEYFEKIFLIFQTLQSRDKFESTGIGLTIVKKIIEEQGGKIRVESEVGKGSKFIFWWPK